MLLQPSTAEQDEINKNNGQALYMKGTELFRDFYIFMNISSENSLHVTHGYVAMVGVRQCWTQIAVQP